MALLISVESIFKLNANFDTSGFLVIAGEDEPEGEMTKTTMIFNGVSWSWGPPIPVNDGFYKACGVQYNDDQVNQCTVHTPNSFHTDHRTSADGHTQTFVTKIMTKLVTTRLIAESICLA